DVEGRAGELRDLASRRTGARGLPRGGQHNRTNEERTARKNRVGTRWSARSRAAVGWQSRKGAASETTGRAVVALPVEDHAVSASIRRGRTRATRRRRR